MKPRADAPFAAAAMLLALAAAVVVLELWNADLRVPFAYTGDATLNLVLIDSTIENAWHFENDRLGAPGGLELYDYPVVAGETLNLLVLRLLALGTGDPAFAMNLFFLLTFPLTALTAFFVLRRLDVTREAALVVSVLYALLPYHFLRGEVHLFLAAYYAVPLGAYLALAVFRGDPLFDRLRSIVLTASLCAVIAMASGSGYYAVFAALLVGVAALLRFLVHRERAALGAGGGVVALITGVMLLQLAPTIVYRIANGANDEVAERFWFESENYALKLTHLLLPVDYHRLDWIADLKAEYWQQIAPTEGQTATLGLIGAVGFLWLVGLAVAAAAGAGRRYDLGLHSGLAALTVTAVLVATTGGFSTLIAVIWPQIRGWNRLSVFIAFFAFTAVALGLTALGRRLRPSAYLALLAAVLAVGVFDQTTRAYVPAYAEIEAEWRHQAAYFESVEQQLPSGSMVVQLPWEGFPEPANALRGGYEPAKPYLHTDELRWSYGAMRGRAGDWGAANLDMPARELVTAARRAGFAGILVDHAAFPGSTSPATELEAVLGQTSVGIGSGRYLLFRL
jgi:hypothetical protein